MYCANQQQVHKKNPQNKPYDKFVIFQRQKADTTAENEIRSLHEDIDTTLAEQNVLYAEITTYSGKKELVEKFDKENANNPLFFILDKHPKEYKKDDEVLCIEWGKYENFDKMKNDVMTIVNSISNKDLINQILKATRTNKWEKILKQFDKHEFLFKTAMTIAKAAF